MGLADDLNYDEWVKYIQTQIDSPSCAWNRVGVWGFPTKDNIAHSEVVIHYCQKYYVMYKNGGMVAAKDFNKCRACGEDVPDGIKMIALLEKL